LISLIFNVAKKVGRLVEDELAGQFKEFLQLDFLLEKWKHVIRSFLGLAVILI